MLDIRILKRNTILNIEKHYLEIPPRDFYKTNKLNVK